MVKASFLFNIKFAEVYNTAIFKPVLMSTNCSVNYSFIYHSKVTHMSSHSYCCNIGSNYLLVCLRFSVCKGI